jgi:Anti-sigma-K factor rskA
MPKSISEEEQILAAGYVLGHLSASEINQFGTALASNPELQVEVDALQSAYDKLPQGLSPVTPPPELKAKIIQSFAAESIIVKPIIEPSESMLSELNAGPNRGFDWGRILAGIGLLVGGLLAFDNFNLRQELQVAQRVNPQALASILNQPKSRLITLSTKEDRVVGNILFTPGNWKQIIVSAKNLPPLPVDRVYRMWLELANGQVIPCGEFKTDDRNSIFIKLNATQKLPAGVKAKGVFITIDKSNDPLQPTGERVIQGTI